MPNFAGFFLKKTDSGSRKLDTWSRNLFLLKHIWVKVSIIWKFQPNWSNNTLKSGFFQISGNTGSRIRNFFGLKPPCDQDGANKKRFSQIGPAVPKEIGHKHTCKQTSCCYIIEIYQTQFFLKYSRKFLVKSFKLFMNLLLLAISQRINFVILLSNSYL